MSSAGQHVFDDKYLVRYLLGALPQEDSERLDELSISDGDFAWRLREIENDLVDSYVRSELDAETLAQFKSSYLASDRGRQKVVFAEGLRMLQAKTARANELSGRKFHWPGFSSPRTLLQLGMAALALAMFVTSAFLFFDDIRLRREINEARLQHGSIDQRTQELERQLNEQRAVNAETARQLDLARKSGPHLNALKTLSLVLPPPTRGISAIRVITIDAGTDLVVMMLTLESSDYPHYRVTLKDPSTGKAVWTSPDLGPSPVGDKQGVSAGIPAELLKQQNYIAEVAGLSRGNSPRVVGDYPFRVVLR
jgi:hypothetical protein